jgi:hypothetical protein
VSKKVDMYGKGNSYNLFAGKDASKALGMSSLKPEDAVSDYSTLPENEMKVLEEWYSFFKCVCSLAVLLDQMFNSPSQETIQHRWQSYRFASSKCQCLRCITLLWKYNTRFPLERRQNERRSRSSVFLALKVPIETTSLSFILHLYLDSHYVVQTSNENQLTNFPSCGFMTTPSLNITGPLGISPIASFAAWSKLGSSPNSKSSPPP